MGKKFATMLAVFRGVAQPGLACLTGGQKVGGSNPLAPTGVKPRNTSVCGTFEFQLYGYGTPSHIVQTMS